MFTRGLSLYTASLVGLLSGKHVCEAFVAAPSGNTRHILSGSFSSASATNLAMTATAGALEELSKMTTISIDSGDLDVVEKYAKTGLVTDATTNPLFVSQAGANGDKRYEDMVSDAIMYAKKQLGGGDSPMADFEPEINLAMDKLAVNLGAKLTTLVAGRVSTEVDIRLSYDTDASVKRAKGIIKMYEEMGIDRSRILIKLAGTWEGIQAAKILEKEGIQCNITLIFSFLQAAAAAQAGAYLVSPFPGRILDWHKSKGGKESFHPSADPGVLLIKRIYSYFKKYEYGTICMPSSWRPSRGADVDGSDVDEIIALAGVDEMTIPPNLLESLMLLDGDSVSRECDPENSAAVCCDPDFKLDEETYKTYLETDGCGKDKLNEGIESFTQNTVELRELLYNKFAEG
jgi:transaldolase